MKNINTKQEKGVTLVALMVTIVVLLILAGITVKVSLDTIKTAQSETIRTNMLLLQAKGKELVENANFKLGINQADKTEEEKNTIKTDELKATKVDQATVAGLNLAEGEEAYQFNAETLIEIGLQDVAETAQDYVMIYNISKESVDVMYIPGVMYNDKTVHRVSEMEVPSENNN